MSLTSTSIWCPCLPRVARQSAGRCPRWDDRSHDGRWHGWREEEARWARGDQPGACGSGDQRRPRGYVVRDLIPPVACTCSWKLVAGLYCRGVSRPGRAALSLWTHCGNEPRRVVDALRQRTACRISLLFPCEVSAMATVVSAALLPLGDQDWMAAHTACHVLARGG